MFFRRIYCSLSFWLHFCWLLFCFRETATQAQISSCLYTIFLTFFFPHIFSLQEYRQNIFCYAFDCIFVVISFVFVRPQRKHKFQFECFLWLHFCWLYFLFVRNPQAQRWSLYFHKYILPMFLRQIYFLLRFWLYFVDYFLVFVRPQRKHKFQVILQLLFIFTNIFCGCFSGNYIFRCCSIYQ